MDKQRKLIRDRKAGRLYRERNREKEKQRAFRYWRENPKRVAIHARDRDPIKAKATQTLRNAVHEGKVEKPLLCQECNKGAILHGHHDDHGDPYKVIWLCSVCHGKKHRKALATAQEDKL